MPRATPLSCWTSSRQWTKHLFVESFQTTSTCRDLRTRKHGQWVIVLMNARSGLATNTLSHKAAQRMTLWTLGSSSLCGGISSNTMTPPTLTKADATLSPAFAIMQFSNLDEKDDRYDWT